MRRKLGLCVLLLAAVPLMATPQTWEERRAQAQQEMDAASEEIERFYALKDAAKADVELGRLEEAGSLAEELLELAPKFRKNWNYGNAVHDGHMVLGRIALRGGQLALAKRELLQAGATPGSPQLNSFGPNMALAKELLERGERQVALQYFELCERFWTHHPDSPLREWRAAIAAGEMPEFGANLVY